MDFYFAKEYIENLAKEIDLTTIKYIVINHTEPDHSGGLRALAGKAKDAIIVCSEKAVYELKEMYKLHDREFLVAKDGDVLDIGGQTLQFLETPYLHTEETMVTYLVEDKILFPCDIFSTHVATKDMDLEGKIGIAYGSYGWSGEAIEVVQDYLLETNITTLETSNIIKSTGMTDVNFPIRIRFSLNDTNRYLFDRGLDYALELVTK